VADDPADAGFYRVANRLGNLLWTRGMRLDRGAGALGAGKASRSRRQAWKPVALGNGTVEFVDRDSGLCLTGQEAAGPGAAGPGVTGQGVTGPGGAGGEGGAPDGVGFRRFAGAGFQPHQQP